MATPIHVLGSRSVAGISQPNPAWLLWVDGESTVLALSIRCKEATAQMHTLTLEVKAQGNAIRLHQV